MRKEKVIEQHKSPQCHIVKTEDGNKFWRNCSENSNGSLDNKMNDSDHNESDATDIKTKHRN